MRELNMSILHLLLPLYPSISCFTSTQNLPSSPNFYVLCQMDKPSMVIKKLSHNSVVRRSANYQPPIWKHEFIQSLKSEFMVMLLYKPFHVTLHIFTHYNNPTCFMAL